MNIQKTWILAALLCYFAFSFSQVIGEIEIRGNRYVPDDLIREIITTKEGSLFSVEKVRRDIRRLFRTGFFRRIEVHRFDQDGRVKILYLVEDLPVIYRIEFEGNRKIDDEDLSEKLGIETEVGKIDVEELIQGYTSSPAIEERIEIHRKLKLGRVLSQKEIKEIINRIKAIYLEEGYPDVEVRYRIEAKKGASKLVFMINEGEKKYVVDIDFKGNKTFSGRKLKGLMQTEDRNIFIFRLKPPFSEEVLKEDVRRIREFYRDEGFLEARVDYKVERKNGRHDILILIEEGPRYRLKELSIEGNTLYAYSELVGDILKKNRRKGGFYRREVVEKIKERIRSLYAEIGFLNVIVEEKEKVDPKKKEVSVTLSLKEGKPVYIRKVKVEGNYETRDYVVRREMRVREGELATRKAIQRSRTRIINLGYYEDVQIQPFPAGEDRWDLLVKIRERFTGQFSVGLSYNEVTRLSGFVSIRKGNFRGTGDIASISLSYGAQYRDNSISYTDKWFMNRPVDLTLSVFDRRIEYVTYTIERTGVSATFSREFWEYWRWSIGASIQRIRYSDIDPGASSIIKAQEGRRESRKLIFSLRRDTRDYFLFPSKGSLLELSYSVGVPVLGGTEKFHRVVLTGSKYFKETYFETGTILSVRGTVGFVEPYGGAQVPLDERFFVGGDFTIRGYDYGMAGTLDVNNQPIGSTKQLFFNFEVSYPLHRMLYVAAFFDTGLGAEEFKEFDPRNWRGGYGIGIRLVTPFAPIRIDWAFKTKKVPGDTSPSRIHFILGGFF